MEICKNNDIFEVGLKTGSSLRENLIFSEWNRNCLIIGTHQGFQTRQIIIDFLRSVCDLKNGVVFSSRQAFLFKTKRIFFLCLKSI